MNGVDNGVHGKVGVDAQDARLNADADEGAWNPADVVNSGGDDLDARDAESQDILAVVEATQSATTGKLCNTSKQQQHRPAIRTRVHLSSL